MKYLDYEGLKQVISGVKELCTTTINNSIDPKFENENIKNGISIAFYEQDGLYTIYKNGVGEASHFMAHIYSAPRWKDSENTAYELAERVWLDDNQGKTYWTSSSPTANVDATTLVNTSRDSIEMTLNVLLNKRLYKQSFTMYARHPMYLLYASSIDEATARIEGSSEEEGYPNKAMLHPSTTVAGEYYISEEVPEGETAPSYKLYFCVPSDIEKPSVFIIDDYRIDMNVYERTTSDAINYTIYETPDEYSVDSVTKILVLGQS